MGHDVLDDIADVDGIDTIDVLADDRFERVTLLDDDRLRAGANRRQGVVPEEGDDHREDDDCRHAGVHDHIVALGAPLVITLFL